MWMLRLPHEGDCHQSFLFPRAICPKAEPEKRDGAHLGTFELLVSCLQRPQDGAPRNQEIQGNLKSVETRQIELQLPWTVRHRGWQRDWLPASKEVGLQIQVSNPNGSLPLILFRRTGPSELVSCQFIREPSTRDAPWSSSFARSLRLASP